MMSYAIANSLRRKAIACSKLCIGPLASGIQLLRLLNLGFCDFVQRAFVATQCRFRMQAHAVTVTRGLWPCWMLTVPASYALNVSLGVRFHAITPLANTVLHVVSVGSKREMSRIHARRSIASMKDKKSLRRPLSCMQKPAHNMCANVFRLIRGGTKIPIMIFPVQCRRPQPAFIRPRQGYFAPEALHKGFMGLSRFCQGVTDWRTVFPDFCLIGLDDKQLAAWDIGTGEDNTRNVTHQMTSFLGQKVCGQALCEEGTEKGGATPKPDLQSITDVLSKEKVLKEMIH